MNNFLKKLLALLIICQSFVLSAQKAGIPEKPNPPKLVNNLSKEFPDFLTATEQERLEAKLEQFSNETSNQIVVLIVDDLAGFEPWEFATEVGDSWKVGQEGEDNGVVLLVKPTGGKGERKTFIGVGRGLEGAIPDLTANEIVENELLPNFKEGNFYRGIDKATDVLMSLAKGEYNHKAYSKKNKGYSGFVIVIIIVVIIVLIVKFGPKGGGGGRGGGFTYGRGGFYGGLGGFGGFGGGGSSGGGGGFGGFGGGSFGGGGSGGSW